jgi:hypothetical protein
MKIIHKVYIDPRDVLLKKAKERGFYVGNFAMDDTGMIALITDVIVLNNQSDLFNPTDDYYSLEVDEELSEGNTPLVCAMLNYIGGDYYFWPIEDLTIPY